MSFTYKEVFPDPIPDPPAVKLGSFVASNHSGICLIYIIALVETNKVALISLLSGCNYSRSVPVNNPMRFTKEEFQALVGHRDLSNWTFLTRQEALEELAKKFKHN